MPILVKYDPAGMIAGAALQSGDRDRFLENQGIALQRSRLDDQRRRTDLSEQRLGLSERQFQARQQALAQQQAQKEALRARQEAAQRVSADFLVPQNRASQVASQIPFIGSILSPMLDAQREQQVEQLAQVDTLDQTRVLDQQMQQQEQARQQRQAEQAMQLSNQLIQDAVSEGVIPEEVAPTLAIRASQGDSKVIQEILLARKEAAEAAKRDEESRMIEQLMLSRGAPPEQVAFLGSLYRSGVLTGNQALDEMPEAQASEESLRALQEGDVPSFVHSQMQAGEQVPAALQEQAFERERGATDTTMVSINIDDKPQTIRVPKGEGRTLVWDQNHPTVQTFRQWAAESLDVDQDTRNEKNQRRLDRQARIIANNAGWQVIDQDEARRRSLEQSRKAVEPLIQAMADRLIEEGQAAITQGQQPQEQKSKEDIALQVMSEHPEWTDQQIAAEVDKRFGG